MFKKILLKCMLRYEEQAHQIFRHERWHDFWWNISLAFRNLKIEKDRKYYKNLRLCELCKACGGSTLFRIWCGMYRGRLKFFVRLFGCQCFQPSRDSLKEIDKILGDADV